MKGHIRYLAILLLGFAACSDDTLQSGMQEGLLEARRYDSPGIYDAQGRFMLMRGVNLNTLGDYWQANPDVPATAPYEADHFRLMASYGFNVVRLIVHWSKLEPVRGQYDQDYIDDIRQAIQDAERYGIYTMLDMHQDAWGKYIVSPAEEGCEYPSKGWDGAPQWATFTDGASTCTEGGRRESAPAVYTAFRNFWLNREGIQDAFIASWQELVRATAHYPSVIGYDALNEPALGSGGFWEQGSLYSAFLSKLLAAIRDAERSVGAPAHIYFFETTVGWAGQEVPFTPSFTFTSDHNIVFAPHNYFDVITTGILTLEEGAALYNNLAGLYGTHCFIGEWGVFGDPASDLPKLKRFALAEDSYFMGSTWWQWCQAPGDPHGMNWEGNSYGQTSMHLLEVAADGSYTGNVNEIFLNVLSRSRPVAIHGRPVFLESDPEDGSMTLRAKAAGEGVTEIWIPDRFGEPSISGSGAEVLEVKAVEGGYKALVACSGEYTIVVEY